MPSMSDDAVKSATGKCWSEWKAILDAMGAAELPHKEIAIRLSAEGVAPWWRQMVTVEYERMIGRRAVGQTCDGKFSASLSKTVAGDMDGALHRWEKLTEEMVEFCGALACDEPRTTSTEKWRYWRLDLEDGSKVAASMHNKAKDKASIGINHDGLADGDAVTKSKHFWKMLLTEI